VEEDEELTIDEYMASVGVDMLHPGGMRRTEELANMCEIFGGKIVLDAGSGFGRTDCHLANKYGCEVVVTRKRSCISGTIAAYGVL